MDLILDAAPLFKAFAELDEDLQSEVLDLFAVICDPDASPDEWLFNANLLMEILGL